MLRVGNDRVNNQRLGAFKDPTLPLLRDGTLRALMDLRDCADTSTIIEGGMRRTDGSRRGNILAEALGSSVGKPSGALLESWEAPLLNIVNLFGERQAG